MLEGSIVNLRVLEKTDLSIVAEWGNNLEFSGEFEPISQRSQNEWEQWYETLRSEEKWFLIEKKDGSKIGQIMHYPTGSNFSIGFIVVPSERSKGYCTEAVKIMVDFLFLSKDIIRIQAETNPRNIASQKVLENAGFTKEGIIRKSVFIQGEWRDGILYSILKDEWAKPQILTQFTNY